MINSSDSALCQVFLDDAFFEQLMLDITDKKGNTVIDAQMAIRVSLVRPSSWRAWQADILFTRFVSSDIPIRLQKQS